MTLDEINEINETADRFAAAGRSAIPVAISEWVEMQVAKLPKGSVKIETDANGKVTVKPVDRTPAPLRRGKFAAGDRAEAALRANAAKARRA